ncbi:MAG TPA: peroxiredoxin family protein, partial [Abditibacteriaceae bacterium]
KTTFGQYQIKASYPSDFPKEYGYFWQVAEIDADNKPIPATIANNPPAWWTFSTSRGANTFNGYVGTSSLGDTRRAGIFQTTKRYRISFAAWSPCEGWRQRSWIFQNEYGILKPKIIQSPSSESLLRESKTILASQTAADYLAALYRQQQNYTPPLASAPAVPAPGEREAALLPKAEESTVNVIATASPTIQVGQAAPEFEVQDFNGKTWRLSDLRGEKNLLLTFFPKCFTGGCANHLSSLRDRQLDFDAADTQIIAISVDPAEGEKGQLAFAKRWQLGFPLVPDTKRELSLLYGAVQNHGQLSARMSVLIDKNGVVRLVDTNVMVRSHGGDILDKMQEIGINK